MYTKPDNDFPSFSFNDHKFFDHSDHDPFDDDFFKNIPVERSHHFHSGLSTMEWVAIFFSVFGLICAIVILCKCCQRRNRGHVINPPPAPDTVTTVPYPQQQYATVVTAYPVAAPYPLAAGAHPQPGMQVVTAYPTPYPVSAAPYPAGPASYPHPLPQPAPYPAAYPHPQPHPHPQPQQQTQPYVGAAPSAPDATVFYGMAPPGWNSQALPPSYDQATGTGYNKNSTPYNPSYGNV